MRIQLHGLVAGTPILFCQASLALRLSGVLMSIAPARFHFVGQYSVRETNAQPAPATGLFKGFGTLSQQAKTDFRRRRRKSVLSICGNKCTAVTIHGLADKENPAVIDSGVFAWLIEVPVYF